MIAKSRHAYKRRLRAFPLVLLIVSSLVSLGATLFGMRSNYLGASPLVNAVFEADRNGSDIEPALRKLRVYTYSHMNVDLEKITGTRPPIQLKNRYEQLKAAEKVRVTLNNEIILKQGEIICAQRFPSYDDRGKKTTCVAEYQSKNAVHEVAIPDSLYKFDFVSPRWSFDLAGISLALFVVSAIALVIRLIVGVLFWLKNSGTR